MNNQKLQNFIDLVTFDQNLIKLELSISSTETKLTELQDELEQVQQKYEQKVQGTKEVKKQLDLQELHVKDLQEKEKHQGTVVEKATSSKEYDAASKELENLKVERDQQENKLMQLWNTHEALEKELARVKAAQDEKSSKVQESIAQEHESLAKLKKDLDEQSKKRDKLVKEVPEEWIDLYDNMRGKVTNPVVPVSQDSCSACFYLISSRDLQTLRQNELVQCKDCYRFLYLNETQESSKVSE